MARTGKAGRRPGLKPRIFLLLLLAAALLGYRAAFNLSDERRARMNKLLHEAKEMPFRPFV